MEVVEPEGHHEDVVKIKRLLVMLHERLGNFVANRLLTYNNWRTLEPMVIDELDTGAWDSEFVEEVPSAWNNSLA